MARAAPKMPLGTAVAGDYFCQVRFLCRFWRSFFRRLCLLIFDLRRFFSDPILLVFVSGGQ